MLKRFFAVSFKPLAQSAKQSRPPNFKTQSFASFYGQIRELNIGNLVIKMPELEELI
jgi:hypothetical protein